MTSPDSKEGRYVSEPNGQGVEQGEEPPHEYNYIDEEERLLVSQLCVLRVWHSLTSRDTLLPLRLSPPTTTTTLRMTPALPLR